MMKGVDREVGRVHAGRDPLASHARDVEVVDVPLLRRPRDQRHAVRRDGERGSRHVHLVTLRGVLQLHALAERDAGGRRGVAARVDQNQRTEEGGAAAEAGTRGGGTRSGMAGGFSTHEPH